LKILAVCLCLLFLKNVGGCGSVFCAEFIIIIWWRKIIMPLLQRTMGSGMSSMSLVLINLAATMERADESLLPAVYKEVSEAFHLSPSQLGVLTFVRILVQALCSPLAGLLAVRYNRSSVIGLGTLLWAFSTAAFAVAVSFTQCTLSRAVNGVGLAMVIPALQSFIADSYLEEGRGVGFGLLNLVGAIGGIAGSLTATLMAGHTYLGVPGWRTAFIVGAVASTVIGCLVHTQVRDPCAPTAPAPTSLSCQDSHQRCPNYYHSSCFYRSLSF
jgi:MFS family permease